MYPGNEMNLDLLKNLINKAYWPIYGDLGIMEELGKNCTQSDTDCPTKTGVTYSYFLLVIYMIIANVLLLNILIAMFR